MAIAKYAITRQGYELLSSLNDTNGKTFKITSAKYSDKPCVGELEEQTELVNIAGNLKIVDATNTGNLSKLRLRVDNENLQKGVSIHQIGIYAKVYECEDLEPDNDGVLLQIWQFDVPDSIPASTSTSFVKDYLVATQLGTADNITINIEKAGYVTYSEFEVLKTEIVETIENEMSKIGTTNNLIVNSNFQVNQLKVQKIDTSTPLEFKYTYDMWYAKSADAKQGALFNIKKEQYTNKLIKLENDVANAFSIKNTSGSEGTLILGQIIDTENVHNPYTMQNKDYVLSFYMATTGKASVIARMMVDDDTEITSKEIQLSLELDYQRIVLPFKTPAYMSTSKNLRVELEITIEQDQSVYLTGVQLEQGKYATKYITKTKQENTQECLSYFELYHFAEVKGSLYNSIRVSQVIQFATEKVTIPTLHIFAYAKEGDDGEILLDTSDQYYDKFRLLKADGTYLAIGNQVAKTANIRTALIGTSYSTTWYGAECRILIDARPYL